MSLVHRGLGERGRAETGILLRVSKRVVIGVAIVLALAACSRGSTTASPGTQESTTSTSASTKTPPTNPAPPVATGPVPETIGSWKIIGETASVPAVPNAVFCLSPDPPAPCHRLDGAIDLGDYGSSDEILRVSIHLSPLSFTEAQFATNLAASPSCACRTTATTSAGRPAWVVDGSTRSGVFRFLATRMSDMAYASVLQWCGFVASCASAFPLDHASRLLADLAPTHITMKLVRWLRPADGQYRRVRVPFGDRACDLRTQFTNPTDSYNIAERVLTPIPISDLAKECTIGPAR